MTKRPWFQGREKREGTVFLERKGGCGEGREGVCREGRDGVCRDGRDGGVEREGTVVV